MSLRVTEADLLVLRAKTGTLPTTGSPSPSPPRNKFNAVQKEVDGHVFDSGAEARRYTYLKYRQAAGEISDLILQPGFSFYYENELIFDYFADFAYMENGKRVVEDVKGVKTPIYQLKRKLIELRYHMTIVEIRRKK
jgi:hypothetical protein